MQFSAALAHSAGHHPEFPLHLLSERGEVGGLEDAYVQFTDIGASGLSAIVGQFQVSDPLFKRELRLPYEDYQPYRVRVGDARADFAYDRGVMLGFSPWGGGDVALMVVNGQGIGAAGTDRQYDTDNFKSFAARYSHDLGPLEGKGMCFACHGKDAKGTPLSPNLVRQAASENTNQQTMSKRMNGQTDLGGPAGKAAEGAARATGWQHRLTA